MNQQKTKAPAVKAGQLIGTFSGAGAIAGLLLALIFLWAQPQIDQHRAAELEQAVGEVLGAPSRIETLFIYDGKLLRDLPAGIDSAGLDRVYAGYETSGARTGLAIIAAQPGFTDEVKLIFGYDPERRELLGMKVLEQRETPGLGDKIVHDSVFVSQFRGAHPPLKGVKTRSGQASNEVQLITGATISSRTVVAIMNRRLAQLASVLAASKRQP